MGLRHPRAVGVKRARGCFSTLNRHFPVMAEISETYRHIIRLADVRNGYARVATRRRRCNW
jgi:hypothetical protein